MDHISKITLRNGRVYELWDLGSRQALDSLGNLAYLDSMVSEDTKAGWSAKPTYVPRVGEIVVYTDQTSVTVDGVTTVYPEIKIGDGNAYVADLPFVGGGSSALARLPIISQTYYPQMTVGGIDTTTGADTSSTNVYGKRRMRTINHIPYSHGASVTAAGHPRPCPPVR